jgi:hypothetical protein
MKNLGDFFVSIIYLQMTDAFCRKKSPKFSCCYCDYKCFKKSDFDKHNLTKKHQILTDTDKILTDCDFLSPNHKSENKNIILNKLYNCECGNLYKHRQSLFNHKKKCNISKSTPLENEIPTNDLIIMLIKQNNDLQKSLIDITKQTSIVNNTTFNNSNNKTFNLQVFLNETCKDAMNISDFVESVKLEVSDLENVGKVGYIEGISNIIIKNLQALDVKKRPVHCADQKREVMYVKDQNIWEKEDETNKRIRKAIREIAHKNICMLKEFRKKYPDCQEYDSKKSSQYNKIVIEAMGGKGDDDYEKETKIIKKIAKEVTIDKK